MNSTLDKAALNKIYIRNKYDMPESSCTFKSSSFDVKKSWKCNENEIEFCFIPAFKQVYDPWIKGDIAFSRTYKININRMK